MLVNGLEEQTPLRGFTVMRVLRVVRIVRVVRATKLKLFQDGTMVASDVALSESVNAGLLAVPAACAWGEDFLLLVLTFFAQHCTARECVLHGTNSYFSFGGPVMPSRRRRRRIGRERERGPLPLPYLTMGGSPFSVWLRALSSPNFTTKASHTESPEE